MQAWEVGVKLNMASNAAETIAQVGRALSGLHLTAREVESTLERLGPKATEAAKSFMNLGRTIGTALAVGGVGIGLLETISKITDKAKALNSEMVKLKLMGMDDAQRTAAFQESRRVANNVRGSTQAGVMSTIGGMQTTLPFDEAIKFGQVGEEFAKAYAGTGKNVSMDKAREDLTKLIRSGERMGRIQDPKTHQISLDMTKQFLDMVLQVRESSHGQIDAESWDRLSKRGGIALRSRTDQGLRSEAFLGQQMGFDQSGTAAMSEFIQNQAGRMPVAVAEQMERLGLLKPGTARPTGGGNATTGPEAFGKIGLHSKISGLYRARDARAAGRGRARMEINDDAWSDPAMAKASREDPLEYIKLLDQKLESLGIHDPAEKTRTIATITGRTTTFRREGELAAGMGTIARDVAQSYKSQGVQAANKTLDTESLDQAHKNFSAAWDNLAQTLIGPKAAVMVTALNAMADGIRWFTEALQKFDPHTLDSITKGIAGLGAVLVAAGGLRLAIGVGGWLIGGWASLGAILGAGGTLALALGPVGWLAAGITAIGAAAYAFPDQTKGVIDWFKSFGPSINAFLSDLNAKFIKWQSDNLPSGSVNDVLNAINKHFVEWQQRVMVTWEAWKSASIAKIIEWKDMAIAALGEAWTAFKDATMARLNEWGIFAKSALNTFVVDIIADIKAWPERLKEAITEFGTKFTDILKDAFKGVLKGLSNPAGPGANPYSNSSYQGDGGYGGLTHLASLGGGGYGGDLDGNGNWSDIGQGGGANDNHRVIGKALHDGPAGRAIRNLGSSGNVTSFEGSGIAGLSSAAAAQYANVLGNRESGNRYGIRNSYGYSGRYQFGAGALKEIGGVTTSNNHALSNSGVWTGKYGSSLNDFLHNPKAQDQAFAAYTSKHYRELVSRGVIRPGMSEQQVAGWLAAAHLKGVGGATALSRGHDNSDANGTRASSYFNMMRSIGSSRATKSHIPPAQAHSEGKPQSINLHVDGRKMAGVVTRHQSEFANGPSHGGQGFDRTRTFAGNDSGFRTAV